MFLIHVHIFQCGAVIMWSIFSKNIHEKHRIARLSGRGMGCLLWAQPLIDILSKFLQWCVEYHVISNRIITALDSTHGCCIGAVIIITYAKSRHHHRRQHIIVIAFVGVIISFDHCWSSLSSLSIFIFISLHFGTVTPPWHSRYC